MKPIFLVLITFLTVSVARAQTDGEKKHPIDTAYDECVEKPDGWTTYGMLECIGEAEAAWDKELNKQYQALMKRLDAAEKAKLKKAQKAWLAYRDAERDFSSIYYLSMEGSMYRIVHAARVMDITRKRALELEGYKLEGE